MRILLITACTLALLGACSDDSPAGGGAAGGESPAGGSPGSGAAGGAGGEPPGESGGGGASPTCGAGPACEAPEVCIQDECRIATSCFELSEVGLPSGPYMLDVDGDDLLTPITAYCDMDEDGMLGAGWTLVLVSLDDGVPSEEVSNVAADVNPAELDALLPATSAKFADDVIAALFQPGRILRLEPLQFAGAPNLYIRGADFVWSNPSGPTFRFDTLEARVDSAAGQWQGGFVCKGATGGCGSAGEPSDFCFGISAPGTELACPRNDKDSAHYRLGGGDWGRGQPQKIRIWVQ